jgi:uncharacterized protein
MKIEGDYIVKAPREQLWRLLIDPAVLQRCVPGCQSLEATEDGSYKMTMKAGIGSIKGVFTGTIRLTDLREPEHYQMLVDGKGAAGFVKGVGTLDFAEQAEATIVTYAGDVNVGGTLASVGQRMVQAAAKLLVNQFFKAVVAEVSRTDEDGQANPSVIRRGLNFVWGNKDASTETEAGPDEER